MLAHYGKGGVVDPAAFSHSTARRSVYLHTPLQSDCCQVVALAIHKINCRVQTDLNWEDDVACRGAEKSDEEDEQARY